MKNTFRPFLLHGEGAPNNAYQEMCIRCEDDVRLLVSDEITARRVGETYFRPDGVVFIGRVGMTEAVYCARCAATERVCRLCGCTNEVACEEGCYWIEPDLCSACRLEAAKAAHPEAAPC